MRIVHKGFVKYIVKFLHEKAMGRKTFTFLAELERMQWVSADELERIRFEKLKKLLIHAQNDVPFYARRFAEYGLDPQRIQCINDIRNLPLLSKTDIQYNLESLQWKACPGGLHRYNTGGSSGQPLVFYFDRRRQGYDAAARALTHRWWGIDVGDKELYLWGSPLEISKQDRIKSMRDYLTNELLLSAFDLSAEHIPLFVNTFKKFKPACVFGYPSTISLFCRMAAEQRFFLDDIGIRVVFSTAEVLYPEQKEIISGYFGNVPVVDGYGSREGGFISHECPHGRYHVMDPNYIIEYLQDGRPVKADEDGEIVITHLDAWGMPFIRYRTGDMARSTEGICSCGRTFSTMSNLRGRTTDFVVTPDGRWQHGLSVIYVVRDIEGVEEFKIIQEDYDMVRVLIKQHESLFPSDGVKRIVAGIKKRMGDTVNVNVEMVDSIPRDASGKYRYVVSHVASRHGMW